MGGKEIKGGSRGATGRSSLIAKGSLTVGRSAPPSFQGGVFETTVQEYREGKNGAPKQKKTFLASGAGERTRRLAVAFLKRTRPRRPGKAKEILGRDLRGGKAGVRKEFHSDGRMSGRQGETAEIREGNPRKTSKRANKWKHNSISE